MTYEQCLRHAEAGDGRSKRWVGEIAPLEVASPPDRRDAE
jgi:hypothetical protein